MNMRQSTDNLSDFVRGNRSVLAVLVITFLGMTCSGTLYKPVFVGTVVDEGTEQPLDSVLVWISDYELPDVNTGGYRSTSGGDPLASDSSGSWKTKATVMNTGGCGSGIDGPAGVEQFYFRFEREGYLVLDTTFSGELLEQNRIKCDSFQVPDISLVADTTS